MQTPAERDLIEIIKNYLCKQKGVSKILNIGAGENTVIENQLINSGCNFICDRLDVEDCQVENLNVGQCYQCSVESMEPIKSMEYNLAFSNFVLEHIKDIRKASSEINRILKFEGIYVATLANPTSPESLLAKITPLWFHKIITGRKAWETHYSYKNIETLIEYFNEAGFNLVNVYYYSFLEAYLERFFILNKLAHIYDKIVNKFQLNFLMNHVCIIFQKNPEVQIKELIR